VIKASHDIHGVDGVIFGQQRQFVWLSRSLEHAFQKWGALFGGALFCPWTLQSEKVAVQGG